MIRKYELLIREAKTIMPKVAVEIGCTFLDPKLDERAESYGMSTWQFGAWCRDNNVEFHSVDIDEEHLETAKRLCSEHNVPVLLHHKNGIEFLKAFDKPIDFLYLDNADDPQITYDQFIASESKLSKNAIVVFDDCHSEPDKIFGKGAYAIPYILNSHEYHVMFYAAYSASIMAVVRRINNE